MSVLILVLLKRKTHCHYTHKPEPVFTWQLEPACSVMTYSRQATLLATAVWCVPHPGSGSVTCCTVHCTVHYTLYCTLHPLYTCGKYTHITAAMANNNMTNDHCGGG